MIEILLGQIPEALYFAFFMLFTKKLKTKRTLFIVLMTLEYILLLGALPYSTWSHILYFAVSYIILKLLYRERAQITDVFTLGIASFILIIISVAISLLFRSNIVITIILSRVVMFAVVFGLNYRLNVIQKLYKKLWNRNDKIKKKIKSTTFRAINIIVFNIMFYVINICMIYALFFKK